LDVLLDQEDVTAHLRSAEVDRHVSAVSAHQGVRAELLPIQRNIAAGQMVVMVGRDIGSVVVPAAGVKIFLDASVRERARRRHEELIGTGRKDQFDAVLADLERRDAADSGREIAPLQIAEGATIVQTDGLTVEHVVDKIEQIVRETWSAVDAGKHVE
jgi:cytidylate kinase